MTDAYEEQFALSLAGGGAPAVEAIFYARTDAQKGEAHTCGLPDAATPVLVISNGSGQVYELDALFTALAEHTLSPRFRDYGNFRLESERRPGVMEFWGNFHDISHVFSVRCLAGTEMARRLNDAIESNLSTPAYAAACVAADKHQAARGERVAETEKQIRGNA